MGSFRKFFHIIVHPCQCSYLVCFCFFFPPSNRWTLESTGKLEPRRSALEDDFEEEEEKEDEDNAAAMEIDGFDKVDASNILFIML